MNTTLLRLQITINALFLISTCQFYLSVSRPTTVFGHCVPVSRSSCVLCSTDVINFVLIYKTVRETCIILMNAEIS